MSNVLSESLQGRVDNVLQEAMFGIYDDRKLKGNAIFQLSKKFNEERQRMMQEIVVTVDDKTIDNLYYLISFIEKPVNICVRISRVDGDLFMDEHKI